MAIDLFSQGKTPFVINWSFAWSVFNDPEQSAVADKVGVMLVPGTNGIKSATCAGSMGLSITSTCQHKDEAWKFIEFLASKEIQKRQAIEAGALPIWEELYSDPELIEQLPRSRRCWSRWAMPTTVRPSFGTTSSPTPSRWKCRMR